MPSLTFLFTIAINELSIALNNALQNGNLQGVTLGHNCTPPPSTHFYLKMILFCVKQEIYRKLQL
jgi:hypothetical protein